MSMASITLYEYGPKVMVHLDLAWKFKVQRPYGGVASETDHVNNWVVGSSTLPSFQDLWC